MFFSKKNNHEEIEESVPKKWIKKMDAIVTGAILGWVVASLYGVKKLKENKKSEENSEKIPEKKSGFFGFFKK